MRKLILAAGCVLLFWAGWGFGDQQATKAFPGGSTWKGVQEYERQMYVVGFMRGYVLGKRDTGALALAQFAKEKLPSMTPAQRADMEEGIEEAQKAAPAIGNTSSLILTAAMSTFYNDQRNAPVCWERAVMLLAASLAGKIVSVFVRYPVTARLVYPDFG